MNRDVSLDFLLTCRTRASPGRRSETAKTGSGVILIRAGSSPSCPCLHGSAGQWNRDTPRMAGFVKSMIKSTESFDWHVPVSSHTGSASARGLRTNRFSNPPGDGNGSRAARHSRPSGSVEPGARPPIWWVEGLDRFRLTQRRIRELQVQNSA